ncbi:MAG: phosphatase PAP2 family protein [Christensenella sp.]
MMLAYLDQSMLFGTAAALSCGFLNILLSAFTTIGNGGVIWIIITLVFLLDKRTRRCGTALLFAIALTYIIGNVIIKDLVMRERPFVFYGVSQLLIPAPHGFSFPSGHAASSFAALTVIYSCYKKLRLPAAICALLIAFSRVYLFVHFPSDVLAGAVLGSVCAYIILAFNHFRPRTLQEIDIT